MEENTEKNKKIKNRRSLDVIVIVLCLLGIIISLYLLLNDILQINSSLTAEMAGTVTAKQNTVKRRQADRSLWDRLRTKSPVYSGDQIWVEESSEAVLHIGGNIIDLSENTLVKIQVEKNISRIELLSGEMSLNTSMDELNTTVIVNGRQVQAGPGALLNIAASQGDMTLQVYEGAVYAQDQTMTAGDMLALDTQGRERKEPAVMVRYPRPNARYLKNRSEPLIIDFAWDRFNLDSEETLQLRIAENRKSTRTTQEFTAIDTATAAVDIGVWYWQLSYKNTILSDGHITVVDASGPVLFSPARGHVYRSPSGYAELRFRWSEIEGASHYLLEVGETYEFENPRIIQAWDTLYINSSLEPGTWYWRVRPVFPDNNEGGISAIASFRIEQSGELKPPVLKFPPPSGEVDNITNNGNVYFSWETNKEAVASTVQIANNENLNEPFINETVQDNFYVYGKDGQEIEPGQYYWNVQHINKDGNISPPSQTQSFIVQEGVITRQLPPPPADPPKVSSPAETPKPPPAKPAAPAKQPAPEPPSLLPEPKNLQPSRGYRFETEELVNLDYIAFSWSPVSGANAYIFSLFHETASGKKPIIQTESTKQPEWILDKRKLDRGTFIWQVEAVSMNKNGTIEKRGKIGENTFIVHFSLPGQVEAEDTGILYGR